jgi:hypothetical protein
MRIIDAEFKTGQVALTSFVGITQPSALASSNRRPDLANVLGSPADIESSN